MRHLGVIGVRLSQVGGILNELNQNCYQYGIYFNICYKILCLKCNQV